MPAFSALLFYSINMLLVAVHIVAALLTLRPTGPSGRAKLTRPQQLLGAGFFFACAALHTSLGLHGFFDRPILITRHGVAWDLAIIVLIKLLFAVSFVAWTWASARKAKRRR